MASFSGFYWNSLGKWTLAKAMGYAGFEGNAIQMGLGGLANMGKCLRFLSFPRKIQTSIILPL